MARHEKQNKLHISLLPLLPPCGTEITYVFKEVYVTPYDQAFKEKDNWEFISPKVNIL